MIEIFAVICIVLAVLSPAIALWLVPVLQGKRGREATVHTQRPDDQTIRGILIRTWPDFVIADAHYVTAAGKTAIDGRARIPRSHVAWWQEH